MNDLDVSKIKVIFFDIGGVLLSNGWGHESRQKAANVFGFDYEEMNDLHNFIYNVFEIGSVTLDDYLNTVVFHRPRNFTKEAFKNFMYEQSVELPKTLEWLKVWKKQNHLSVFALNNESRELNTYRIERFRLHEVFDGFFSSCYMGIRKPDPRLFERAMEISQVSPEQCIYFDDREMFVKIALNLGITAIHHQNFETTRDILETITRN